MSDFMCPLCASYDCCRERHIGYAQDMEKERDAVIARAEKAERERDVLTTASKEGTVLMSAYGHLIQERDEARAECAAMREALIGIRPYASAGVPISRVIDAALSGPAGKALLRRVSKLEAVAEAAKEICYQLCPTGSWHIDGTKGDRGLGDALRALDEVP